MYILTFLHAAKIDRNSKQIMRDEQIEFENFDMKCTGDCFIHEHFNLGIEYQRVCKCGRKFPLVSNEANNFAFIFPMEGDTGFFAQCEKQLSSKRPIRTTSGLYGRAQISTGNNSVDQIQGKFPHLVKAINVRFNFVDWSYSKSLRTSASIKNVKISLRQRNVSSKLRFQLSYQ